MDSFGKHGVHLGMKPHLMAHVNEPGLPRADTGGLLQGFGKALMRPVRFDTQSIHHQTIQPLQHLVG